MSLFKRNFIYIKKFLNTDQKWTSDFCDSWVREHQTAGRKIDFFYITREYQNEIKMTLKNARIDQVNITLNELNQVDQNSINQLDHNLESRNNFESDHKNDYVSKWFDFNSNRLSQFQVSIWNQIELKVKNANHLLFDSIWVWLSRTHLKSMKKDTKNSWDCLQDA